MRSIDLTLTEPSIIQLGNCHDCFKLLESTLLETNLIDEPVGRYKWRASIYDPTAYSPSAFWGNCTVHNKLAHGNYRITKDKLHELTIHNREKIK
jgi:hypothetical protein